MKSSMKLIWPKKGTKMPSNKHDIIAALLQIAQRVYDRYNEEADAPTITIQLRCIIEALGMQLRYAQEQVPEAFKYQL